MPIYLPLLAQVRFEGASSGYVTDHGRQPTSVSREEIKKAERMANGTMREKFVATKRKFDFSWADVPSRAAYTVDGYWSGEELISFFNANRSFTLKLFYSGNVSSLGSPEETVTVMWDSAIDYSVNKRGPNFDFWDMNLTLVEV
jgi:hypothetical protein